MTLLLFSVLSPIEEALTVLLEWLHTSIGLTWAWAIVVLTVLVRMALVPVTVKQVHSMAKMQQYAPHLKALKQKYGQDRQRYNEEVMKFYRENKVNPAASCLPILFQIPIFFALYFVLRDFDTEIFPPYRDAGETFADLGWLSIVPDITASIPSHWSGWLLLTVYVGSQVASTFYMATSMEKTQRYIMMALPFVFVYFIVNPPFGVVVFPVGLLLYWATTNLWTVGQGLITRRLVPKPKPAPKRTSRTEPKPREEPAQARKTAPKAASGGPQRVRRRKKKGPRARR